MPLYNNEEIKSNKGVANGYASLDTNTNLPATQLPIIESAGMVGTVTFESNYIIGTFSSPVSAVLPSFSFTNAVLGMTVTIYHNSATAPIFPASVRYKEGYYVLNAVNEITFTSVGNSLCDVAIKQISTSNIKDIKLGLKAYIRRNDTSGSAITAGGATETIISGNALHPTPLRMVITAVGDAKGRTLQNHGSNFFLPSQHKWAYSTSMYFDTLSNSTDRYVGAAGFLSSTSADPSGDGNCILFLYSDNRNSGKLQVRIKTSGQTELLLDTNITVAAATLYECQLEYDSELRVYINGSLTNTQAINIQFPAAVGRFGSYAWKLVGTNLVNSLNLCEQVLAVYR